MTQEERLRELGLLNLEKGRLKRNATVLQISGRYRGHELRHFWQVQVERKEGSGH